MAKGDEPVKKYSRSSLRVLGTVGEPINPEAWRWYYEVSPFSPPFPSLDSPMSVHFIECNLQLCCVHSAYAVCSPVIAERMVAGYIAPSSLPACLSLGS